LSARPATPLVNGYRHGRVPRAVREQQLLDIAERQFAERGYDSVSIEEIAQLAGVSRPMVYDYLGDKEAIYLGCLRRARGELEKLILAAAAGASTPRQTLERATAAYFEFVERRGQQWMVLFGGAGLSGPGALEAERLRFATVARIRDLIVSLEPGVDPGTAELFAHAISGSAEQVAKWWRANPELDRSEVLDRQAAYAWGGLSQLFDGNARTLVSPQLA
jgi:AcrR family transcriptional regulator